MKVLAVFPIRGLLPSACHQHDNYTGHEATKSHVACLPFRAPLRHQPRHGNINPYLWQVGVPIRMSLASYLDDSDYRQQHR